jgi:ADP-ribose pyrophosphatase
VDERMTIYLAQDLIAGEATPMDDERIEARWFPAREVERMIDTEKVVDAKTMVGFYRWKSK